MSRAARAYVALVLVVVVLASAGAERPRAFFGLDPAAWIVVGQMASVVSNLMAMRDTMMRIRDEALSSYRGLVEPIDDFAGRMRLALGEGAQLDLSALGGADPREFELADCASLPPADAAAVPCTPDAFPEPGSAYADLPGMDPDAIASLEASHEIRAADFELQLAEADHRDRLVEEAMVAIGLYHGCEPARADADRRGVIVCPASRAWTAAEREGLRQQAGGLGERAEHRRLPGAGRGRPGPGGLPVPRAAPVAASRGDAGPGQPGRGAAQARCRGRGPRAPRARARAGRGGPAGAAAARPAAGPRRARPVSRYRRGPRERAGGRAPCAEPGGESVRGPAVRRGRTEGVRHAAQAGGGGGTVVVVLLLGRPAAVDASWAGMLVQVTAMLSQIRSYVQTAEAYVAQAGAEVRGLLDPGGLVSGVRSLADWRGAAVGARRRSVRSGSRSPRRGRSSTTRR